MAKVFTVGLTGGIGSGKTKVSDCFAVLGATIIDTDLIAHQLTAPNAAGSKALASKFGNEILEIDGRLNRTKMREMAFASPTTRIELEAILHPLIQNEASRQLDETQTPYAILVVPLLVGSTYFKSLCNRILVVDCEVETQIQRVKQRSGLSESQIQAIINAQSSREERLSLADDIISNEGDHGALIEKVKKLHQGYLTLAQLHKPLE